VFSVCAVPISAVGNNCPGVCTLEPALTDQLAPLIANVAITAAAVKKTINSTGISCCAGAHLLRTRQ